MTNNRFHVIYTLANPALLGHEAGNALPHLAPRFGTHETVSAYRRATPTSCEDGQQAVWEPGSLGRAFTSVKRAGSNGALWTSLGNSSMSSARRSTGRGGCS
jgi:hypothetical protein